MLPVRSPNGGGGQEPEDRAGLGAVARGGTLNLAGAALSAAATLGVTIAVTRVFSRSVAGAFFAATSLFLIIETVSNLGAYNGLIYFIAQFRSQRSRGRIPSLLRAAVIPVTITSIIAAAAMLVFAEPLARLLLGGHLGHGAAPAAVATALRGLALTLPFAALLDTYLGASRGYRDMHPTVVVDRIGRSGLQLLGVSIAALSGTAALLAPLWALPYVPASVLAWVWFHRVRQRAHRLAAVQDTERSRLRERPADGRAGPGLSGFWKFNAPRALATIAQMTIQRLDIVLVGIMKGPVEAAVYTAATRFLVVGQLGNAALSMAAQPQFTHLFAIGDRRGAGAVYQVTTAWLIILTWPLYLLAAVDGPTVLAVFGHSYQAGSTVMVILGLTMLIATGCGQVDMVLTTTGRTSWSLLNGLAAVGTNVGLDLVLIPRYGITGAAIGWAAAIVITNLVPLAQVASVVKVHPFGRGTLTACALTTVSFGLIPLAARYLVGRQVWVSALGAAAGCVVLAAGLWLFRDPLQLALLPGIPRRRPGPGRGAGHPPPEPGGPPGPTEEPDDRTSPRPGQHRAPGPADVLDRGQGEGGPFPSVSGSGSPYSDLHTRGVSRALTVIPRTSHRIVRLTVVIALAAVGVAAVLIVRSALTHHQPAPPHKHPPTAVAPSPTAAPVVKFRDADLALVPRHGVYLGAYVQPETDTASGFIGAVQSFQASTGRSLRLVHVYSQWQKPFPDALDQYVVDHGKVLLLTWGGSPNTKAIIAGRDDGLIRARAEQIKALHRPILLEFRHEMDRPNLQWTIHGPADYIAAWDHIRKIFTQVGATNASWVWCPTGYGFQLGRAQAFYPGNSEVDWVCADVYANSPAQSLKAAAAPFLSWAQHTGKPVILGEFGVNGQPGQWPGWLAAAAQLARSDRQIRAMAYFDANGNNSQGHPFSYWLGDHPSALTAFSRLLGEPFFRPHLRPHP
jgi:O-antigen/teichoic acid export membrane protein